MHVRHFYSPAVVVSLWVMALATTGSAFFLRSYRNEVQSSFDAIAGLRTAALQRSLDEKLLILQSMHSLYSIFDGQPQPQFRRFVQPFEQRMQGIQALQWVVPVPAAERASFEQSLRDAGIAGFRITERADSGDMVPAGDRAMYYPVYPLLPLDEGEASIGFDIASTPGRKAAVDAALASGEPTASGRIPLLQQNGSDSAGFFVLSPLFAGAGTSASTGGDDRLLGLVLGVFDLASIVDAVQAQFSREALVLEIRETADDAAGELLIGVTAAEGSDPLLAAGFRPQPRVQSIAVANRQWEVHVQPAPGYMQGRQPWAAVLVFVCGVLLALGLSAWLSMRARHELRLQQALRQRESLEHQLVRAQRRDAIAQLVGGIAHDFNNLLQSVLGNVELLSMQLRAAPPDVQQQLAHINSAAERGNGLIRKLLAFSRNAPTPPQVQQLAPLVENTLAMLRPLVPASIQFSIDLARDLPPVLLDATSFDQVLLNLCLNARDAIEGPGKIAVRLYRAKLGGSVCQACQQVAAGDFVVLELADTGSGIDATALPQLFEPFFTTKAAGKGTGLGLPIINYIVHSGGGHILLTTTPGKGTTFRILLPVAAETAG